MTLEEAQGLAAQVWCKGPNMHKVMDVDLAEGFAEVLMKQVANLEQSRNNWKQIAKNLGKGQALPEG